MSIRRMRRVCAGLWLWLALAGCAGAAAAADSPPGMAVRYSAKARPLAEVLQDIAARSGIRFRLATGLGRERISAEAQGGSWPEALGALLQGYNYAVEAGPGGVWQTVRIVGKNGDGKDAPALPKPAGRPALAARPAGLPVRFQGFKPESVTPVTLPVATLKAMKKGQKFALELPGGRQSLVHDNRFAHGNGETTWVGYSEQDGLPYRTLITLGQSGPMGYVMTAEGNYQIVTEGGQSYLIDLDAAGLQAGSLLEDQAAPNPGGGLRGAAAAEAGRADGTNPAAEAVPGASVTIDLLVLHSKGLAQAATRVNHLAALANQAFLDSKVNAQIRIVHREAVDYTEANDNAQALSDLSEGRAPFGKVAAWRDQYGADLVALIRPFRAEAQKNCGIAWVNGGGGSALDPSLAYSVVGDGNDQGGSLLYCGEHTLAHELGHNLGNVHDRPFSASPGAYPYSYAWGVEGLFGTIMSYRQPTVPLFSTPLLGDACRGQPCGYAEGEPDASDNAKTINQTAPAVAGFRPAAADKAK